jgi:hypothetical protein
MYGRRPRTKSVPQAMAEIREIYRLGLRQIFVVDENFIGNKGGAKALLSAIAAWQTANGYAVEFMTEVSLNVAQDDELLQLMKHAKCSIIFVGIESPRVASLKETKKHQNVREDILTSVHHIQKAGIQVMAGMIVGFDNDDPSIFDEQFRFIQDARIPISMTGMLNALPKTPLYKRLKGEGRLISESVGDQFVFTNIIPKGMSRLELYEGYRRLLSRLYDYGNYRRRAMALILHKRRSAPVAILRDLRGRRRICPDSLDVHPSRLTTPRLAYPLAHRRDHVAAPAGASRSGDLGPAAQAPVRVRPGHLRAAPGSHRRAEDRAVGGRDAARGAGESMTSGRPCAGLGAETASEWARGEIRICPIVQGGSMTSRAVAPGSRSMVASMPRYPFRSRVILAIGLELGSNDRDFGWALA